MANSLDTRVFFIISTPEMEDLANAKQNRLCRKQNQLWLGLAEGAAGKLPVAPIGETIVSTILLRFNR
jgi:hypothetical protein